LRNLGANILILFLICGCVTPSRKVLPLSTKATSMGTRQLHRHPTIHANRSTRHELSDIEKDKLFQGFMRWLTVNGQGGLGALVEAGQPPKRDEEVRLRSN
jgi:hypothetical protein